MAPSFDHLREEDLDEEDFDLDEVDISDLREKYEVQLEQGYDAFVVIDGLPVVTEEQKPKLVKFLLKKLNTVGRTREDLIFMPMGEDGKSLQYVSWMSWLGARNKLTQSCAAGSPLSSTLPRPKLPPPSGNWTTLRLTRSTPFA